MAIITLLIVLSVLSMFFSLHVGRFGLNPGDVMLYFKSLCFSNVQVPEVVETVLLNIRIPRVLAAFFIGGSLALSGCAYQALFRNPMVSPSILGVSAGAGFGAAVAILFSLNSYLIQLFAFVFGITAVIIVYFIGSITGRSYDRNLSLILIGMIITAVFTALLSSLKYIADPNNTLPAIEYWLMGGLSGIQLNDLTFIIIISVVGIVMLSLLGWKLDILSFGEEEAQTIGVNVKILRISIIIIATLLTAAAVSISGVIGWVGLLIPHIARMIVGTKHSVLLPASFLIGAVFLILVDDFSRSITSIELPLGITTALIGAPFFIFVLLKSKNAL